MRDWTSILKHSFEVFNFLWLRLFFCFLFNLRAYPVCSQVMREVFFNTAYSFKDCFIKSAIRSPELYLQSCSSVPMVKSSYLSGSSININHWLSTHTLKRQVPISFNFFEQNNATLYLYIYIFLKGSSLGWNIRVNEYVMLTLAASGSKMQISGINNSIELSTGTYHCSASCYSI